MVDPILNMGDRQAVASHGRQPARAAARSAARAAARAASPSRRTPTAWPGPRRWSASLEDRSQSGHPSKTIKTKQIKIKIID